MKVSLVNTCDGGSTGNIMFLLSDLVRANGGTAQSFSKRWRKPIERPFHSFFGTTLENGIHVLLSIFFGAEGLGSYYGTKKLVKDLGSFNPEVLHLHNLHGSYINLPLLFRYVKKHHIPVVWTLHDCWPFTGRCPYFDMTKCSKWKAGCGGCPYPKGSYPQAFVDRSNRMWKLKKKLFTGVEDMTIVTPSKWLASLVKQSYLNDYPIRVIHNGIDLSAFKPTESDFQQMYGIGSRYMLLGVADSWGDRKGLDVFVELSKKLDPAKYQIVLVGTNDGVDKLLPQNIISIHHTRSQMELAEIYTAADLFVNPTREDNYPTVNMESLACGTPVVTFRTGGSPESLDETCGSVVECGDIDALEQEIRRIEKEKPYTRDACVARARKFDSKERYREYLDLYVKHSGGGYKLIRFIRVSDTSFYMFPMAEPDSIYGKAC